MTGSRFLRGVIAVAAAAAAAGGAAAGGGGSAPGTAGRIVFSSDRAPNLVPQLTSVGVDGSGRRQLTHWRTWAAPVVPSPDGTRVAYVADALRVANADGSNDHLLVPRSSSRDLAYVAWSPDSTKIAYTGTDGSLFVVSAADGAGGRIADATPWTRPAWSPDGAEVAFGNNSWEHPELDAVKLAGDVVRTVVATPSPVRAIAWSRTGDRIAYVVNSVAVVKPDGSGQATLTDSYDDTPAFSPDGTRLAYATYTATGWEIAEIGVDGSGRTLLTSNGQTDLSPAWSPDGKLVAFLRTNDSGIDASIVVAAADGSGERVVQREGPYATILPGLSWTPDGHSLLYAQNLVHNDRELFVADPGGDRLVQLTRNGVDDSNPSVSPDGRLITFDRGAPGNEELYAMRISGGGLRRLTTNRFVSDVDPSWSPDGASIAFASNRFADRLHIFVMSTADGHVRRLTRGAAVDTGPEWSPDGGWVAFTSQSPDGLTTELWAVRPNGSGLHRLPAAAGAHALAWSPDGRAYAYLATEPGTDPSEERTGLFVTRNGRTREVRQNVTRRPTWSPDGSQILWGQDGAIQGVAPNGTGLGAQTAWAPGATDQPSVQRLCDVFGTARNDVLLGTPGDDVICGLGGNDIIRGGGGNDTLIGGDGNDTLVGGSGSDLVFGGNGNDTLRDRDGTRDVLDGGPGRDRIVADRHDVVR